LEIVSEEVGVICGSQGSERVHVIQVFGDYEITSTAMHKD
jgi:hypothetical protein